jgi:hypothetical protein
MAQRHAPYARLERAVRPWVRSGELDRAVARCEAELAALPRGEYHAALGRSWLGQTREASRWLAGFYRAAAKTLPVRALYCEMNRLEINPDEWHLDAFAYDFLGDPEDLGWLVGWKKSTAGRSRFVLRGMGDLRTLFARHYGDEPPAPVRVASEVVILLLTLRMQELVHAAVRQARHTGQLPHDVPVLVAAHDSDLVCFCYGPVVPPVTRSEAARPPAPRPPRPGAHRGIYKMEGGYDEFGNSLPWDLLDYASETDQDKCGDQLNRAEPLAESWTAPRVTLRRRKWRSDLIQLYPHWAVNETARAVFTALVRRTVEFLPLRCVNFPDLWVLHPLRHIDLAPGAVHNATNGSNMTVIRRYAFEINDLKGKHLFGVKQTMGSSARKAGLCFAANYVSEEFKCLAGAHGLQGVVFERVFAYRPLKEPAGEAKRE